MKFSILYIIVTCDISMAVNQTHAPVFIDKRRFSSWLRSVMKASYCVCGCSYISLKNRDDFMFIIKKSNILKNLRENDLHHLLSSFIHGFFNCHNKIISKFDLYFRFLNLWDTPLRRKYSFLTFILFYERVLKEKCVFE